MKTVIHATESHSHSPCGTNSSSVYRFLSSAFALLFRLSGLVILTNLLDTILFHFS
uniref:Uncharacterized protein n=1 Tax=Arundo donax TaxID=35708 RepID=A0A0A8YKR7_ARUDO